MIDDLMIILVLSCLSFDMPQSSFCIFFICHTK
jgi:hypothetical protein